MSLTVLIFAISGAGVFSLALLFAFEQRRGQRLGEPGRAALDRLADRAIVGWHTLMLYIGSGAARVGLHYVMHRVLRTCAGLLAWLHERVEYWRRRNRRIARTVQAARTDSHLSAIAEHKHATALSDEEKTSLKEKTLAG
ncbi:MAG TPA: hypothetical protein VKP88_04905 [Candidatus Paceibacterota bacterium]|nr:hypothetical protein [Candidatus Paceibacterota bacterium]